MSCVRSQNLDSNVLPTWVGMLKGNVEGLQNVETIDKTRTLNIFKILALTLFVEEDQEDNNNKIS